MEFYNVDQIVKIQVQDTSLSKNWIYFEPKSFNTTFDFIFNHKVWKINKTQPIYQKRLFIDQYFYTKNEIQDELNKHEYIAINNLIYEDAKITILFINDIKYTKYFHSFRDALFYVNKIKDLNKSLIHIENIDDISAE